MCFKFTLTTKNQHMLFRHKCTIKFKGMVLITINEKKGYSHFNYTDLQHLLLQTQNAIKFKEINIKNPK
jgi:hypothetical protein